MPSRKTLDLNDAACANLKCLVDTAVKVSTGEIDLDEWIRDSQTKPSNDVVVDSEKLKKDKNPVVAAAASSSGVKFVGCSSSDQGQNRKRSREEDARSKKISREAPVRLCEAVNNYILGSGGCAGSVILVMQKDLLKSDVDEKLNRLSIPHGTAKELFDEKLQTTEVEDLASGFNGLGVTLVEPSLSECDMRLKNWENNSQFALVTKWKDVVKRNELRKEMNIQLWMFRRTTSLCFALVKTPGMAA